MDGGGLLISVPEASLARAQVITGSYITIFCVLGWDLVDLFTFHFPRTRLCVLLQYGIHCRAESEETGTLSPPTQESGALWREVNPP